MWAPQHLFLIRSLSLCQNQYGRMLEQIWLPFVNGQSISEFRIIYKQGPLLITLPPARSVLGPSASQAEKASFSLHPSQPCEIRCPNFIWISRILCSHNTFKYTWKHLTFFLNLHTHVSLPRPLDDVYVSIDCCIFAGKDRLVKQKREAFQGGDIRAPQGL